MKVEEQKQYKLVLSESEARWLKTMVQNPIGVALEEEDETSKKMRHTFWIALESVRLY